MEWRKKRRPEAEEDTTSGTRHPNALCWGRHYVFPASEMDFAPLHASFPHLHNLHSLHRHSLLGGGL